MDRLTRLIAESFGPDARDRRIAELELLVQEQREIIARLEDCLDALAVSAQGDLRIHADLPERRRDVGKDIT